VGGFLVMTSAIIKLIFAVALILIALAFGPIVGIWSLNTLFPTLAIPYTWQTWLAFNCLFGGSIATRLKK
jgi:hypothetical protein